MDVKEKDFQRWLRKQWRGWSSSVEYGLGGDEGFPDMLFLVGDLKLLPVELKVGKIVNGVMVSEEIRPAQIRWHRELWDAGGSSVFLFGVPVLKRNDWVVYVCSGNDVVNNYPDLAGYVDLISPEDGTRLYEVLTDYFGDHL